MIYLLKSINQDGYVLRVSYTNSSIDQIKSQYSSYCPYFEVLDYIESGTKELKNYMFGVFSKYHIKGDWFNYNLDIVNNFKNIVIQKKTPNDLDKKRFLKNLNNYQDNFKKAVLLCIDYFEKFNSDFSIIPNSLVIKDYLNYLSLLDIKSLKYNENLVKSRITLLKNQRQLRTELIFAIDTNKEYSRGDLLSILNNVYMKLGITEKPKLDIFWLNFKETHRSPSNLYGKRGILYKLNIKSAG